MTRGTATFPAGPAAVEPEQALTWYTREEFLSKVMRGQREARWLRAQIKARKIREFNTGCISHAEAMRFINGGK